ncbi:O-antigen ligase family protein [Ascidiimonas sp. W6]|uniref:O-antigen ligase family protein n=1 Tax=Ascidiimonas meishanensis TaxID=3128903 RepID=UPI0030EB64C7
MKNLVNTIFYSNGNFSLVFAACLLLSAFPILPYGVLTIAIIVFAFSIIWDIYNNSLTFKLNFTSNFKKYLLFTLFYFLLLFSSFWSEDSLKGLNSHTVGIPILIFPLSFIFGKSRLKSGQQNIVLTVFVIASITAGFFILGLAYKELSETGFKQLFYTSAIRRNMANKSSFLRFHPTYISTCFLLSIGILISRLRSSQKATRKIVKILFIVFLLFMIIICASRAAIITLVLAGFIFFIKSPKFKLPHKVLIITVFSLVSYLAVTNIFLLSSRFLIISNELVLPQGEKPSSISIRYGIYKCSYHLIKENWLFGVGVGDTQTMLNKCYNTYPTDHFKTKNINTHNYFFHLVSSAGIFALIALISLLVYLFKIALLKKNDLFLLFMIILTVNLLFENLLVRSYGVIFFCFFITYFFLSESFKE